MPLCEGGTAALQQQPVPHVAHCARASSATIEPNHLPQQHLQQQTHPRCCGEPAARFCWGVPPSRVNPLCHSAGIPVQQQTVEHSSAALCQNRGTPQRVLIKVPWVPAATNSKQQHQSRQPMLRLEPMTPLDLQALSSHCDKPHSCLCADSDAGGLTRGLEKKPLQCKDLQGACGSGVYATLRAASSAAKSDKYPEGVKGPNDLSYETSLRYLKQNARAVAAELNYACQ